MTLISCIIPKNVDAELLAKYPNVTVKGNTAFFKGVDEDKAYELIEKAAGGKRSHLVRVKAAIAAATDTEQSLIKPFVHESEDVSKYMVVTFEVTRSTVDTGGERILGNFQKEVLVPAYKSGLPFLFEHNRSIGTGKTFDAWTEEVGDGNTRTLVKSYLPDNFGKMPNGESAERNIKTGVYDMSSISWFPTHNTTRVDEIGEEYILTNFYEGGKKPRVIELSLVAAGAHPDAKIQRKSIEFNNENDNTSKKMEAIKYKSAWTDAEVELKSEAEATSHIEKLEKAITTQAETIEALRKVEKAAKEPIINKIQNLENTLKLKSLDEDGMKEQAEKLAKKSLEDLGDLLAPLEAMAKAAKGGVFKKVEGQDEEENTPEIIW